MIENDVCNEDIFSIDSAKVPKNKENRRSVKLIDIFPQIFQDSLNFPMLLKIPRNCSIFFPKSFKIR